MKKILIVYDCDNGYKCACHGRQWEETEIHEIPDSQDIQDFVNEHNEYVAKFYDALKHNQYGPFRILRAYLVVDEFEVTE